MTGGWFPVLRCEEAVPRHVAQTALHGEELAIWRDDAGRINVWRNRCPHRSVRLSIGTNMGDGLKCRYHGFEFESGTARCTLVPAHPDRAPAAAVALAPYPAVEKYGYIWTALKDATGEPVLPGLDGGPATTLRSVFIAAPAKAVAGALDELNGNDGVRPVFALQPVDKARTVVHGALPVALSGAARLAALRHHNTKLVALKRRIETP